ncbi:MAG: hypothetical protein GX285_02030 [Clostridiales bacterium]|nr:hypothetical protein [Clostridiales bacterium]
MNCGDIREKMSLYIDNLLNEDEEADFRRHLSECKACNEEYEFITKQIKQMQKMPEVELPKGFKEELHAKLLSEQRIKSRKKMNWRAYGAIAAVLLVVVVSVAQSDLLKLKMKSQNMDLAKQESAADSAAPEEVLIASDTAAADRGAGDINKMMITAEMESGEALDAPMFRIARAPEGNQYRSLTGTASSEAALQLNNVYLGYVTMKNMDVNELSAFVKTYENYNDDIYIQAESKIYPDIPEITISMLPESFDGYLQYILGNPNTLNHHVDVIDYSDSYNNELNELISLENAKETLESECDSITEEAYKEDMGKKINEIENQINIKNVEIQNLVNEASRAYITIEIQE